LLARRVVNASRYRADVLTRLLYSHTVAEAPDCRVVMGRSAWIFAVQIGRQPQIHLCRESKSRRKHADNGEDGATNLQVRLRQILRRSEMLPPVSIADKNGRASPFFRIASAEIPSDHRLNTEDLE